MFIPRTLSEVRRSGNAMLWRAIGVGAIVAVALFLVLSANITLGQENLEAGQIAERDIRAPRDVTFDSASETQAARDEAAAAVDPVDDTIESPVDNQADQLAEFDTLGRRVVRILELRDAGSSAPEVSARASPRTCRRSGHVHRDLVAEMPLPRWTIVAAAARTAVESTLAGSIREDALPTVRASVRDLITTDLAEPERAMAGDLAAGLIQPNVVIDEELTADARDQARAEVPPVPVSISAGEAIVREGDPITIGDIEALVELGLTRPAVQAGTVVGNALIAAIVAGLLVAFLWRFEPEVWHRNRSVLLFFLSLVVSAVAHQDRRRSDPVGVRGADVGHRPAHRHPAAELRRRGDGRALWRCWPGS